MRILALDQFSDRGGGQEVLLQSLAAFRERGWTAMVAAPGDGALHAGARALGFEARPLGSGPYHSGAKTARDWLRFVTELGGLAGQIRRAAGDFAPDVLYVNGPRLLPAAARAGIAAPALFHCHSYVTSPVARAAAGLALRRLNARIVGVCDFVCRQWEPFVQSQRMTVVYNGVAGPPPGWSRLPGPPRVGCVGRISPEKGQLAFLEAARLIRREVPACTFRIHGAPLFQDSAAQRYAARVRGRAAGLPVEFAGWTDDVYAALAKLDVLLVPSAAHEATTRVIPEAWAAGVPVIAFPAGGISEIVRHGHNGLLACDAVEMAQWSVRLLSGDGAEAARLAAGGRESWTLHARPEVSRERLLGVITGMLREAGATSARPLRQGEARP